MNRVIARKKLDSTIETILNGQDEDKIWEFYLATVANSFSEQLSYEEFKNKLTDNVSNKTQIKKIGVNNREMKKQVEESKNILSGFNPNKRGG